MGNRIVPPRWHEHRDMFGSLVEQTAEDLCEKGHGAREHEQIRILWASLDSSWAQDTLGPWLEETYGAVIIATFAGRAPYSAIDASSKESMPFDLARKGKNEVPMIRQARGTASISRSDIRKMCHDYQIDCVFFLSHKDHKDQDDDIGCLRQLCREMDMPLLTLASDIFDPASLPIDELKCIIAKFFEAQGWAPIK